MRLPEDDIARRPQGEERQDLKRRDNDIGRGGQRNTEGLWRKPLQNLTTFCRKQQRMGQRKLDQKQRIGKPAEGRGQRAETPAHAEIHLENHHAHAQYEQAMAKQAVERGNAAAADILHQEAARPIS